MTRLGSSAVNSSNSMWSPVTTGDCTEPAPAARCKHSATLLQGHVYVLGGKSGNVPLKDFWRFSLANGQWTRLDTRGERPPCLQEHSAVAWRDQIYVFGGEVGFSAAGETPLWAYDSGRDSWRKVRSRRGVQVPCARRGHTALVHRGAMLVYGGYQDLRGSSADLWAFHFDTESWHLLSGPTVGGAMPPARHKHSAVLHGDAMWVYGGMTDLVARADLWRWDTGTRTWNCVRGHGAHRPGPLHGHAAAAASQHMLLLGGDDVWRFHFTSETWERLDVPGVKPAARSEAVALTISDLLLQHNGNMTTQLEARMARTRQRTANNKVSPCDGGGGSGGTTYTAGASVSSGFMSRLSVLRAGGSGCQYTALHADSTESLLRADTPARLPKSRSSYHNHQHTQMARDPVSVPNFTSLDTTNNTSSARLVFLDASSSDDDDEDDSGVVHVKPAPPKDIHLNTSTKKVVIYENLQAASYSSHLGYAASSGGSTSDYASLESPLSPAEGAGAVYRTRGGGFCNPNYLEAAALLGSGGGGGGGGGIGVDTLGAELLELRPLGPRRAVSAGRADPRAPVPPLHVYLVGGRERHVTVFKRPVSIWKLQLY